MKQCNKLMHRNTTFSTFNLHELFPAVVKPYNYMTVNSTHKYNKYFIVIPYIIFTITTTQVNSFFFKWEKNSQNFIVCCLPPVSADLPGHLSLFLHRFHISTLLSGCSPPAAAFYQNPKSSFFFFLYKKVRQKRGFNSLK